MKVKCIAHNGSSDFISMEVGGVYEVKWIDDDGDAWVIDSEGDTNILYSDEFEVVNE